jgi:adenine-specific DNA-methyltransferase
MYGMSSQPRDNKLRKQLGAWYTPQHLVRLLVDWAIRSPADRVMDPAVGDGAFLVRAIRRFHDLGQRTPGVMIWGADINPEAVESARSAIEKVTGTDSLPELRATDFFNLSPPRSWSADEGAVDAVVGNPPFIRYQSFSGKSRRMALDRALQAGVRLTSLSSSWAAFVVHASNFIKPKGRLAFVLPEEFLHASYAGPVRDFLRRNFSVTAVVSFNHYTFPDSQERIVLLCASDRNNTGLAGLLKLAAVDSPENIVHLDDILSSAETFASDDDPGKWRASFSDEGSKALSELASGGYFIPLGALGKASIGYVSGANRFFVLRASESAIRGFPRSVLAPTVVAARQVPGAVLTRQNFEEIRRRDDRCLLWTGKGESHRSVSKYIREGISKGVSRRYKCRVRKPWYVVPGVTIPHAFLTYMSDKFPRFILNEARVTCSNTLLAVRLDRQRPSLHRAIVVSFFNSATLLSAEVSGRPYGGGVLKLEPREADRVLVPALPEGVAVRRLGRLLPKVDQLLRNNKFLDAIDFVDQIVLSELLGVSPERIEALRSSWLRRSGERRRTTIRVQPLGAAQVKVGLARGVT